MNGGRGYAHVRAADYASAIRDYDAALAIDPEHAYSLWGRAYALEKSGDPARAEQGFAAARFADPAIDRKMAELGLAR